MPTPGATRSTVGASVEDDATRPLWVDAPTVSTWGYAAGDPFGLPSRPPLPAAATTSEPDLNANITASSSRGSASSPPKLRLITPGPSRAASAMPWMAAPSLRTPNGLASQTRKIASGYTPTIPTPLFGAATTELTSVPWSSSSSPTVCRFIKIVFGREANSGCVMSMPESTTVTGFPGPGGSTRSAPIAARHHSLGTSGSVGCSPPLVLTSSRSGCATTTAPAARSRASVRASTRQMCSSGTSSRAPARRARSLPAPGFSCARSARAGAALASRTTVTISRRRAKAPTVVAAPRFAGSWRPGPRGYTHGHEPPRRARRVRGRARDPPEEGVHGGLRALPLLRPHAGRHVSLQPPRPRSGVPAELPVLPPAHGGRLGLGQEPTDADHPARGGVDVE